MSIPTGRSPSIIIDRAIFQKMGFTIDPSMESTNEFIITGEYTPTPIQESPSTVSTQSTEASSTINRTNIRELRAPSASLLPLESSLTNARSFAELVTIIRQIREGISFFGGRYVYAIGYEGELHIDVLGNRTRELAYATRQFSEEERSYGSEVEDIINRLYIDNDIRMEHLNLFSYILCKIRDYWNQHIAIEFCLGDRHLWEDDTNPPYSLFGRAHCVIAS